jgi:hypothetical protein
MRHPDRVLVEANQCPRSQSRISDYDGVICFILDA